MSPKEGEDDPPRTYRLNVGGGCGIRSPARIETGRPPVRRRRVWRGWCYTPGLHVSAGHGGSVCMYVVEDRCMPGLVPSEYVRIPECLLKRVEYLTTSQWPDSCLCDFNTHSQDALEQAPNQVMRWRASSRLGARWWAYTRDRHSCSWMFVLQVPLRFAD